MFVEYVDDVMFSVVCEECPIRKIAGVARIEVRTWVAEMRFGG